MRELYHQYLSKLMATPGKKFSISEFVTDQEDKPIEKGDGNKMLAEGIVNLSRMQEKLYADNSRQVLIIFQAMDAAGKDGVIKHVITGFNPLGVNVHSFKTPTSTELEHDYFWRHYLALPARGEIAIFNRSHYENVLITKVHPEYILKERLPGIESVSDITEEFWEKRYKQINRFEKNLVQNGTVILKFFLHVSKEEQKKRFLERIDDPAKNWKFSSADAQERGYWNQYQQAYEAAINATSTKSAPWFVIPADDKWFARLAVAGIIHHQLESLQLNYPELSKAQLDELKLAKKKLESEKKK